MEITITDDKYNPLIKRKEITGVIDHINEVTPDRESARSKIAALLNTDVEHVVLQSIIGHFGSTTSKFLIHLYDDEETKMKYEAVHILKRNKLIEEKKEG